MCFLLQGNTYAEYTGQGLGCRTDNSTQTWCQKSEADFCGGKDKIPSPIPASGDTCGGQTAPVPLRAVTIGGQCNASEKSLPPRCSSVSDDLDAADAFAACATIPGMGGACYNSKATATAGSVRCVRATELAELAAEGGGSSACKGFSSICTLY
eukprot:COSAG06_NODE_3228_length_5648_cov_3.075329_2_plen_154_part_00